jgi:hypothetical protein
MPFHALCKGDAGCRLSRDPDSEQSGHVLALLLKRLKSFMRQSEAPQQAPHGDAMDLILFAPPMAP